MESQHMCLIVIQNWQEFFKNHLVVTLKLVWSSRVLLQVSMKKKQFQPFDLVHEQRKLKTLQRSTKKVRLKSWCKNWQKQKRLSEPKRRRLKFWKNTLRISEKGYHQKLVNCFVVKHWAWRESRKGSFIKFWKWIGRC